MIRTLLIANRGEIACRIIRTARRLGIRTVAVHSEADRDALHVRMADEARSIGPAAPSESYLKIEAIVSTAKEAGADAIHPGYGFLAENAGFAEACAAAGIVFVGPPPSAIRAMGDKAAAKSLMERAKVPVVPGYHGAAQDDATMIAAAQRIGYPVLVKASAGGGGKGMRVVREARALAEALAGARREAKSAFGDDRLLIEKYLERPRHIEVQVFADGRGNVLHLFERDCSVQRRHQKVVEEAPAPGVDETWRARIGAAAVAAARAVDYAGAGTVEFIVETGKGGKPGAFYFMEMNTRLQVEHPVTELIAGVDLVEWQLRAAAGDPLDVTQDDLEIEGHAIEVRLYAEDPARDFLPAPGRIAHVDLGPETGGMRIDTGIDTASGRIPAEYDPMIAKLSAWGEDRDDALRRLAAGLGRVRVVGVTTNLDFLGRVVGHPEFAAGGVDTGFIDRHREALTGPLGPPPDRAVALACLAVLRARALDAATAAAGSADPHSPWARVDGWRLNDTGHDLLRLLAGDAEIEVDCRFVPGGYALRLPGGVMSARLAGEDAARGAELIGGNVRAVLDGTVLDAAVIRDGAAFHVFVDGRAWRLDLFDPLVAASAHEGTGGRLTAPMPGKVTAVHVKPGDTVTRGQALLVVEAMKMEHTIHAPADGRVAEVRFRLGDQVSEGEVLIVVEEAGS